ncbi:MAG: GNAT family N-acetyltransferase [Gemmatimonadota bacterium]
MSLAAQQAEGYALVVVPEIRLEPALPADAAPIAQMSRRLIERGLAWQWTPQAVAARIPDSETAAVVARTDRRMVGFAIMSFRFSRREAHLLLMAVDPGLRRSGVGKALWGWLETLARRGSVDRVQLEVRAENLGASAFYWSLGFREVARLPGYYQAREDALCMVAELRTRRVSPISEAASPIRAELVLYPKGPVGIHQQLAGNSDAGPGAPTAMSALQAR